MSTTTTSSFIKATYLANTALLLSSFITLNNTYVLTNPSAGLEMLGFAAPTSKDSKALAEGLVQMQAASRIALGVSSIVMWWYRDYRALGWATMAGVVMSGVDGLVCDRLGGTGKWVHWGSASVSILLGGGLLALVGI